MNNSIKIAPSMGQLSVLFKIVDSLIGPDKVRTILEFGSRYGEDTIEFAKKYPGARIYSFECNPKSLNILKERINSYDNIIFNENAISDVNEKISFYQINEEKTKTTWSDGNQGASSIFVASGKYPIEEYHQDLIIVDAITLDIFMAEKMIPEIDIMWMDIQGAELKALKGMGEKLNHLKIVHLEVEFIEIYKQQPLFKDVNLFLLQNNFSLLGFSAKSNYSGDAIYVSKKYFNSIQIEEAVKNIPDQESSFNYFFNRILFKIKYLGFKIKKRLSESF